jgi:protein arginine N-methyltransferase 1
VSRVLDEHRQMLADPNRLDALDRAVRAVVRPGDIVVDLGSGTGILGLMACRAGAAHVYSIDDGEVIAVARAIARANRFDDRITFFMQHSSTVDLPRRVDVVLADQIGHFGFEAGLLESFSDARSRFLEPAGSLMPQRVRLMAAPVESEDIRRRIAFWCEVPAGFDVSPAVNIAVNTGYPLTLTAANLLGPAVCGAELDLATAGVGVFGLSATLEVSRGGILDAIGGWFVADLAPGITMTNSPEEARRINRQQVALPLGERVLVAPGDAVTVSMRIRPADHLIRWTVDVRNGERRISRSTLGGMLLPSEHIGRTRPDFVPRLTARGHARRTVLELCDGARAVVDIEREVFNRHRDLFATPDLAQRFVAEVVTRYGG